MDMRIYKGSEQKTCLDHVRITESRQEPCVGRGFGNSFYESENTKFPVRKLSQTRASFVGSVN